MAGQVVDKTGLYTIESGEREDYVIFTWHQRVTGRRLRAGAKDLLAYVREHDVSKVIIDASAVGTHDRADRDWLQMEWTPKMTAAGVESIATVTADGTIDDRDPDTMRACLKHLSYAQYMTDSLGDAKQWITTQ